MLWLYVAVVATAWRCAVVAAQQGGRSYEGYQMFTVASSGLGADQMQRLQTELKQTLPEVLEVSAGWERATYLAPPASSAAVHALLLSLRLRYRIDRPNIAEMVYNEKKHVRKTGFSWDAYYDIDRISSYLEEKSRMFPEWTQLVQGGRSYEGRNLTGLRIFTPTGDDSKPAILIESGIHAREWIAPAAATYLVEQLLTSEEPAVRRMRDTFDWHIFPSVNPDGYHYSYHYERMWRKTRSKSANGCYGADPNRNWDHNWGQYSATDNPCHHDLYAGSRPFSEVETRSLARYVTALPDLRVYVALHSYGQMLLVPYSDSVEHYDNYLDLVDIGKTSLEYGKRVNGTKYTGPATAAEILYKASGGSMDWVRSALGTPLVYTYELRGRYFHWPPARIPEQGRELVQMLRGLLDRATELGYF